MISTKGRYALRVMIDLAEHEADGRIPLKRIQEANRRIERLKQLIVKSL